MEKMQQELFDVSKKVDELHFVLYKNGFTNNVKRLADTLEGLHGKVACLEKDLNDYILTRELTCPIIKKRKAGWRETTMAIGLICTGLGTFATLITLVLRISGLA